MNRARIVISKRQLPDVYFRKAEDVWGVKKRLYKHGTNHREEMYAIALNQANRMVSTYQISSGSITSTVCDLRILAQFLILQNATACILVHNHPSGTTKPSDQDRKLTRNVTDSLKLFDIKLLDHLIFTEDAYYSMADHNDL